MRYSDITATMVLWKEAHRMVPLIERLREYFDTIAVVVQDSPDSTLDLAHELADIVTTDRWRGYGDASFGPVLLPLVKTPWSFKVDGDEMPTIELLESLGDARDAAQRVNADGAWVRFRSWTEEIEWTPYHSHLRLFRTRLGWPSTLHSRPMIDNTINWETGWIEHRRSTDEMVRDYLNYYRIGRGNPGWDAHNREMLHDACVGAAEKLGWTWVEAHEWWPEVKAIAFSE